MMKQFQSNSYLFGGNAPYIEDLYESYLDNPGSVPEQWREYFDQMQLVPGTGKGAEDRDVAHAPIIESFALRAKQGTLRPARFARAPAEDPRGPRPDSAIPLSRLPPSLRQWSPSAATF